MKRLKKSKVSWSPGPKLCQVKLFRKEDCPAEVGCQPQRFNHQKQFSCKPRVPDLPPGFEGNHYANKLNVLNIPKIKWKRPPKVTTNDTWHVGGGGESTETRTENLRISKVMEAIYPHRSAIPSRPSISPLVESEPFDDSKTPVIRLTPIEDEWEESPTEEDAKPSGSVQEPVSGLAPDVSVAATAALSAMMKTKEQGSMVDHDLLIKLLSDPKMVKNLMNDKTGKSSETVNQLTETNSRHVPQGSQHVTSPQPLIMPRPPVLATSKPFSNPDQRRVSPPKAVNVNVIPKSQINKNSLNKPMPVPSFAKLPPLPPSSLPMNINHQRPQHIFPEPKVMQPQPQFQPNPAFRSFEMNNVQPPIGFGRGHQTGFNTYPMNINRVDAIGMHGPRPVVQPFKSVDYCKNLVKDYGTVNHYENNQYHSQQNGIINNGRFDVNNVRVQKQCVYFASGRGCNMGESCMYLHDWYAPSFEAGEPNAKRMRLAGRYENYGL